MRPSTVSDILATNYRTEKDSRSALLALKILAATHAKHRNFEWVLLANRVCRPRARYTKQTVYEKQAADSTDLWKVGVLEPPVEIVPRNATGTGMMAGQYNTAGTALVLTLSDGSAGLYPLTGDPPATFRRPESTFYDMASSPDDKKLVTAALTGGAIIYDAATKKQIVASPAGSVIPQATWTWSPDQAYVISLHADPAIRIWDATTLDPGSVVVLRNDDLESGNLETIYDDAENDLVGLGIDEWLGFPPQQCFSAVALMARPSRMPAPTSPIFHGVVPGRITCL